MGWISAAAMLALAAGCSSGSSPSNATSSASGGAATVTGHSGGTLNVLMASDTIGYLDPARSYSATSENISPLFIRTLTMYVPSPSANTKIVGNLATNAGVPSDGARTWTFHLRSGLTYENGAPITSQDVKYGVERSFAPDLSGGPPYLAQWLIGAGSYKGPYQDKNGLSSIQTPNPSTIVFKLNQPVADFNFLTTYPQFSGVPAKDDSGVKYDNRPLASGPYKIGSYQRGKTLTLVRDPRWKAATEPYAKAYPDTITFNLALSADVINQRLIADAGPDKSAISLDQNIQGSDLARVLNDPQVKNRSNLYTSGGQFTYLAMNLQRAPFNKALVRQAMQYAVDKQGFQTAAGGPTGGGPLTSQIIGPNFPGHAAYDLYPAGPTGNPAKAKALLAKAGYPHGFSTTMDVSGTPQSANEAQALQSGLARAGITVKLATINTSVYNADLDNPKTAPPLAVSGWGSDWNSPSTIIPELFNGSLNTPTGPNNDITNYDNATVDKQIKQAQRTTDTAAANRLWGQMDKEIMRDAPIVPLLNSNKLYLHGSNVRNAFVDGDFDTYNPLVLAVQ